MPETYHTHFRPEESRFSWDHFAYETYIDHYHDRNLMKKNIWLRNRGDMWCVKICANPTKSSTDYVKLEGSRVEIENHIRTLLPDWSFGTGKEDSIIIPFIRCVDPEQPSDESRGLLPSSDGSRGILPSSDESQKPNASSDESRGPKAPKVVYDLSLLSCGGEDRFYAVKTWKDESPPPNNPPARSKIIKYLELFDKDTYAELEKMSIVLPAKLYRDEPREMPQLIVNEIFGVAQGQMIGKYTDPDFRQKFWEYSDFYSYWEPHFTHPDLFAEQDVT